MSDEALLNESHSLLTFRFHQLENKFYLKDVPLSTVCDKSSNKNKVNRRNKNASSSEHHIGDATPIHHTNNEVNCDDNDSIVCDIVKARKNIQLSLASTGSGGAINRCSEERVQKLEIRLSQLEATIQKLTATVSQLMSSYNSCKVPPTTTDIKKQVPTAKAVENKPPTKDDDDDNDIDLFGSDDDEEANTFREKCIKEYAAKKAKKPSTIAKSSVVLDIKPWDDKTDMEEMQSLIRTIQMDGLVWGTAKLVPLAYGIKKLQIVCVIEDEKVSVEELSEKIQEFEDHVQSVDIAAFNKI